MFNHQLAIVAISFLLLVCFGPTTGSAADEVAPPAEDETLIYVLREGGGLVGRGGKMWIGLNDQSVARVKNKGHAIIRTKAGRISLNMATAGLAVAQIGLDDRAGETIYLKWRLGDSEIREVTEEEGKKFLRKSKRTDPIDAPRPNNEEIDVLINLSRLGFALMRPAKDKPEPDQEKAIITIFRRDDGEDLEFGIWGERDFLGSLKVNEGIRLRVPAGDHFFLSGNVGTTLLKTQVEAGKQYFAWLDFGKWAGRVRLTPVTREESSNLDHWLSDVQWVATDAEAINPRIQERVDIVTEFVRSAAARTATGDADFHLLGREHAF